MNSIRGVNFISRVVSNLDTSLTFYRDVIGLRPLMEFRDVAGPEIEAMTGLPGVRMHVAMLRGETGATFELMQFVEPPGRQLPDPQAYEVGHSFIALEVTDIEQARRELSARGAQFTAPAQEYAGGKFAYLWGPDGELIELMEYAFPTASSPAAGGKGKA
jgi:catechol 2,3-dioxygenase-like lactoylglutathione lyase family enzyme